VTDEASSTRDRLIDAAISLFASRGYAVTSTAEIQVACGLSPGSGALYKHFPSKQALLRAAAQRQLDRMAATRREVNADRSTDTPDLMRRVAEAIWDGIEGNAELFRLMFREPEAVEDFADELWSGVIANAYKQFGAGLKIATETGAADVADPEATGAVLIAALAYLPVVNLLIGRTPGDIDPERFREAWVRLATAVYVGAPTN